MTELVLSELMKRRNGRKQLADVRAVIDNYGVIYPWCDPHV